MSDAKTTEGDAVPSADEIGKPASKKKLIIIIAVPLLLLGVAGGLYASGMLGGKSGSHAAAGKDGKEGEDHDGGEAADAGPSAFYELPDMIVNLTGDGTKQRFLKLSITLELNKASDEKLVEAVLPRVMDHFQTYLRELRIEDLRGSAGIYRLRQELLDRVRSATNGVDIKDVLFEEVLVQ